MSFCSSRGERERERDRLRMECEGMRTVCRYIIRQQTGTADVKSPTAELRLAFGALTELYQSMTVAL